MAIPETNNDKEFTNKFYKDMEEQVYKNHAEDVDKNAVINGGVKFINEHPGVFLTAILVGVTAVSYKLQQRLISTAIFKANQDTVKYIANNYYFCKENL